MTVDPGRALRNRLVLEAEGRPGLLPLLEEATGAVVAGRFKLTGLLAVGRQSYIFAAEDSEQGKVVVVKQCAFDYRNPLLYNRATAARLRQALRVEYEVLQACRTGHLPRPVVLVSSRSPVPAAQESPVLANDDVFLVEERIAGLTLTDAALSRWPALPPGQREAAAARVGADFSVFWDSLCAQGWHYGDVSPDNLLVEESGRLRVVDAGSAVPTGAQVLQAGYTPAYTTPQLFRRLREGRPVSSDLATVLPMLAKVLHFALTGREALNGKMPDLEDNALGAYSPLARQALEAMLFLDSTPAALPAAREAQERWSREPA